MITSKQLSKKEYKYRNKIICEYHLKKADQKRIDDFVSNNTTYRKLYFDKTVLAFRMVSMRISNFSNNVAGFGVSVKEADGSFRRLTDIFTDLSDVWDKEKEK